MPGRKSARRPRRPAAGGPAAGKKRRPPPSPGGALKGGGAAAAGLLLGKFPLRIRRLAASLRALVRQTVPGISEAVRPGSKLICYRLQTEKQSPYFCFIAPFNDVIHLGFEDGSMLSDDHKLLSGNRKRVRHVVIRTPADIRRAHLSPLIAEAAIAALLRELIRHQ